ncbi:MAG TPA: hypothetical protein VLL25_06780 [Acidimicrobiales bacterium]|nr:hypothetical protein [Acidimicrobiales bacterium]
MTIFIPSGAPVRPVGRVTPASMPAVELATTVHAGSHAEGDLTLGLPAPIGQVEVLSTRW